jgi:protoporphyrinogen oxidase
MNKPIVILGAGPAGLACAHKLLIKRPNAHVIILDRAEAPGGAGASFQWKKHTLDYGPHAFHTRGGEPEQLIRSLFEGNPEFMIQGRKRVKVFLGGKFLDYPLTIKEAILKFNPLTSIRIILEFSLAAIIHQIVSIPVESFEDWGRKRFGSTLYRLGFGNYTEKVWKTDPNKISRKFASEKIQGFSFLNLVKKLLRVGGQVTEPYYQTWIYHRDGSGAMYQKLADTVIALGAAVVTQANIKSLNLEAGYINQICYEKEGAAYNITPEFVVNTIGLPKFIDLLGDHVPFTVKFHSGKLSYISLILVYIEFAADIIGDDNWFLSLG